VPKAEFVSHMKARGQEKHDERAAAKEEEQPEVDLSSLPNEPVAEETTTTEPEKTEESVVPVQPGPEKTEETTDVPDQSGPEETTDVEQPQSNLELSDESKKELEEIKKMSPEELKTATNKAINELPNIFSKLSTIKFEKSAAGGGKKRKSRRNKSKRRKSKRRKSKRRKSKRRKSKRKR